MSSSHPVVSATYIGTGLIANCLMNLLKSETLTWWQMGILKLSVLFIGIAIGANWPSAFVPYSALIVLLGLCGGIYIGYIWFYEGKSEDSASQTPPMTF